MLSPEDLVNLLWLTLAKYSGPSDDMLEDDSSDSEEEDAPHFNMVYNHTKKLGTRDGTVVNNIVEPGLAENRELLSISLANDARTIHRTIPKKSKYNKVRGLTTVACVALKEKATSRVEKFVFTNFMLPPPRVMLDMAHSLGYHVVQTQESHAEAGIPQFLQERENTYERKPAGIGCHRVTCQACDNLLDRPFFEERVHVQLPLDGLDANGTKTRRWNTPPALVSALDRTLKEDQARSQNAFGIIRKVDYQKTENPKWAKDALNYRRLDPIQYLSQQTICRYLRKHRNVDFSTMTVEELLVHCMIIVSWCPARDIPTDDKVDLLEDEFGYMTAMQYLSTVSTIIDDKMLTELSKILLSSSNEL